MRPRIPLLALVPVAVTSLGLLPADPHAAPAWHSPRSVAADTAVAAGRDGGSEAGESAAANTGPLRVALQAGHWKAMEAPDEQAGLRDNGGSGGGRAEWEVNLEIARRAARLLAEQGYLVEVLPTTIPPGYRADLFIAIHADASGSASASGFRAAAPRRDATGRAQDFADLLERSYAEATGLPHYPTVTRRMRGYYAFNHRRYRHALHPATVAVILETGFLTSARDRRVLVGAPDRAARGIAEAAARYLQGLPPRPAPAVVPARPWAPDELPVTEVAPGSRGPAARPGG